MKFPIDSILSHLAHDLKDSPADVAPGCYRDAILRCINMTACAEEWAEHTAEPATWLRKRLDPTRASSFSKDYRDPEKTALEVAVARRFADVAYAVLIDPTPEHKMISAALLRTAHAVAGPADMAPATTTGQRSTKARGVFLVGDRVRVVRKVEVQGALRWTLPMNATLGKVGTVKIPTDKDGDIGVEFPSRDWWYYRPESLEHVDD